jgi:nitrate/nitrite transporter NarK
MTAPSGPRATLAVACLVGGSAGWAMTAAGAGVDSLVPAYGVDLVTVGLMTTALALTYALLQLPAGSLVDRIGPRRSSMLGLSAVVVVHVVASSAPETWLALTCRALAGAGYAVCFVSGAELARSSGTGITGIGVFGGVSLAASGVAVAVVPLFEPLLHWRSAWATSGLVATVALVAVARIRPPIDPRLGPTTTVPDDLTPVAATSLWRDAELYRLAGVHALTLGAGVVLSNWATVVLVDTWGFSRAGAAVTGSLVLGMAVLCRPAGGELSRRRPEAMGRLTVLSLIVCAVATLALSIPSTPFIAVVAVMALGLFSGLPFAAVLAAGQAQRPDRPGAAVGLMNGIASSLILVGTPLLGAAIDQGITAAGLQIIAVLWLVPLAGLPRTVGRSARRRARAVR